MDSYTMKTVYLYTMRIGRAMLNVKRLAIYSVLAFLLFSLYTTISETLTLAGQYPRLKPLANIQVNGNLTSRKIPSDLTSRKIPSVPEIPEAPPDLQRSHIMSREFPNLPDPCVGPRRHTGVEDLLCKKPPEFSPAFKNPCWYEGRDLKCLPYFHLIGNSKCGTTDFFKRLYHHPDIVPNTGLYGKETFFWSWHRMQVVGRRKHQNGTTLETFIKRFKSKEIEKTVDAGGYHKLITGHGDPMDFYEMFGWPLIPQNDPNASEPVWTWPHTVRHVNKDVKLLLMLREPVDRLYSHYLFHKFGTTAQAFHNHVVSSIELWKGCTRNRSIRACMYSKHMADTLKANIYGSFYSVHLKEWLSVFPREQIHIFRTEDYATDMMNTLKEVFNFLNITTPDDNILQKMKVGIHTRETSLKKTAGPMMNETRNLLLDLYRPYTHELAGMLDDKRYLWEK